MQEERDLAVPTMLSEKALKKKPPKRDDELWKGILDDTFDDFLRFFFPDADVLFDLKKRFFFIDKELSGLFPPEENVPRVRFVDKLVKVHLKNGGSKFILVHVEVQGYKGHEDLSARMFRYFYRAKDKHNVSITAFAVLIDRDRNYHPKVYKEEYLGTKLSYEFNTYKLLDQDEAKLRADDNPFSIVALVVLMAIKYKKVNDDRLMEIKLDLFNELDKRNISEEKREKIMAFLAYYVNFKNPEMMIIFEEKVRKLTGTTTPMGVKEILLERREKQGIEKGAHEKALAIALQFKKLGISITDIAKGTGLSIEIIKGLKS